MKNVYLTENIIRQCIFDALKKNLNEAFADKIGDFQRSRNFVMNGKMNLPELFIFNGDSYIQMISGKSYSLGDLLPGGHSGKLFKISYSKMGKDLTLIPFSSNSITINGYSLKENIPYILQSGADIEINGNDFKVQ